jgi:tetratricopeptide (TPR) repeat protein
LEARRRAESIERAIVNDLFDSILKEARDQTGRKDYAKAAEVLERAIKRCERNAGNRATGNISVPPDLYLSLADAYIARKDYAKAAAVLARLIDLERERSKAGGVPIPSGNVSHLSDWNLRLARAWSKSGEHSKAATAYHQAVYYCPNGEPQKRRQIENEWSAMTAKLIAGWEPAIRGKISQDPTLKTLAAKYPLVILHSRRYAAGGYLQSAYSFVYETAQEDKHGNDVQLLFDNVWPPHRTFQINMVVGQRNTVTDLGDVDFDTDPPSREEEPNGPTVAEHKASEGHVYLEKVEDDRGNRFFVLFKIVALDKDSRYMALIWRKIPRGKVVRGR